MKISIILTVLSLSILVDAPSYKVKKGVIFKDKVEVGTVSGDASLTKFVDLTFKDKGGNVILTMLQKRFRTNYPGHEEIYWNELDFVALDIQCILLCKNAYINESKVIKFEFENRGVEIFADGFHRKNVEELLLVDDYTEQLRKDTLTLWKERDFYQRSLDGPLIKRDYSAEITFKPMPREVDMYYINQGANLKSEPYEIGRLAVVRTDNIMEKKTEIVIMKHLAEPVMRDGEETEFVEAGYIRVNQNPELFTYQDGKTHNGIGFQLRDPVEALYSKAVKYMMRHKYL
tara:strand:+ start:3389 stop:4252 length:864 start_codon:yes stop_codon:yes gene_type:complete